MIYIGRQTATRAQRAINFNVNRPRLLAWVEHGC